MRIFILVLTLSCHVFAQASGSPAVITATGVNLPSQRIGPNDLIEVSVYGSPELSRSVRVDDKGNIRMPMITGPIHANGLLAADLEIAISDALQKADIIVDPVVSVAVTEYRSRPISVMGAVSQPVTFQAVANPTLLEAIGKAGGFSATAGSEVLISKRVEGGDTPAISTRIRIRDLLADPNAATNLRLEGGEEIRVPEAGKIFVVGNVKKPGVYPVQDKAEASVLRALAYSEGLSQFAGKTAYIFRRSDSRSQPSEIPIKLQQLLERKVPDVPLLENDVFYVPDDSRRRATASTIEKILLFGSASSAALIYGLSR